VSGLPELRGKVAVVNTAAMAGLVAPPRIGSYAAAEM
jgi:hypothetical protein